MRKRLRRKLHLCEFREDGFDVKFSLCLTATDQDDFLNRFIVDVIEANGLTFGGGCGAYWDIFITKIRGSVTEPARENVRNWLEEQPNAKDIVIGPLVDAWWWHPDWQDRA